MRFGSPLSTQQAPGLRAFFEFNRIARLRGLTPGEGNAILLNVLIVNMLIKGGPAMETDERALRIRDAIDALIHLMRLHHRIVERRIDGLGVHHSQHRMLMKVARLGRSASQKEIAEAMDVSPACVARTLKRLSAEGLVEKTGGADGRCNEIAIRPRGRALVDDSLALFRQIDEEMFDGISGEELAALTAALRRIQGNLSAMEQRETNPVRKERADEVV